MFASGAKNTTGLCDKARKTPENQAYAQEERSAKFDGFINYVYSGRKGVCMGSRRNFLAGMLGVPFAMAAQQVTPQALPATRPPLVDRGAPSTPRWLSEIIENPTIRAQDPPYNLPANVFMVTKRDMERAEASARAEFSKVPVEIRNKYSPDFLIAQYQMKLIEELFRRTGLGSKASKEKAENGLILSAIEMRDRVLRGAGAAAHALSPSGGFRAMMQGIVAGKMPSVSEGAIIVAEDGRSSDADYFSAIGVDTSKLSPHLHATHSLWKFVNLHEAGHHRKGIFEGSAELDAARIFQQHYPSEIGTIRLEHDWRRLGAFTLESSGVITEYGDVPDRLADFLQGKTRQHERSMQDIAAFVKRGFTQEDIDESEMQAKMLRVRIAVFEEYAQLKPDQKPHMDYLIKSDGLIAEFLKICAVGDKLQDLMRKIADFAKKHAEEKPPVRPEGEMKFDPFVLQAALGNIQARFDANTPEGRMISGAIVAVDNLRQPEAAYDLKPNRSAFSAPNGSCASCHRIAPQPHH